jgi:threonine/homoserine/homoserine lactone efflux protein
MHSMTSLHDAAAPLAAFTFVMSITPGPNNLLLLSSGARFGMRRTAAHLLGITTGFLAILLIAYAGVAAALEAHPALQGTLTVACVAYLVWLGYQLLREGWARDGAALTSDANASRPHTWLQATLFQLVNPKGWGAAVTAAGIVARDALPPAASVLLLLGVTALVNPPCTAVWALFGASLRPVLRVRWVRAAFNLAMAVLILATAWWMARPLMSG